MNDFPRIPNTPGLTWRRRRILLDNGERRSGWEGRWRPRTDLVTRGYPPTPIRLWMGIEPSEVEAQWISDRCVVLQDEMLIWANGGIPTVSSFDGTLRALAACYQSDPDSRYRKIRYATRKTYDSLIKIIMQDHGTELLEAIKGKTALRWHAEWQRSRGIAQAHGLVGMLRILFGFGATIMEDEACNEQCERLCAVLHKMKFEMSGARVERLTAEQATAVRRAARAGGRPSIALAQAFQFECTFRQKDVIGEWVPMDEPEQGQLTPIHHANRKWLRGIRWSEIDANLILRHKTSKRLKDVEIDLKLAPMVIEELKLAFGLNLADELTRAHLPATGPIIVCEGTGHPWGGDAFRKSWRKFAQAAGVPDEVHNMDSRAGAITEATDSGAALEDVRHAATHSNIAMTQRYSRGGTEKVAGVMGKRIAHRNASKT
jgi:hypothetical protein